MEFWIFIVALFKEAVRRWRYLNYYEQIRMPSDRNINKQAANILHIFVAHCDHIIIK
jgi:hypothetical protein